jgi:hypothetical protein
MKRFLFPMIVILLVFSSPALAQKYYLNIEAGAGYARYITDMDQSGLNQNGIASSIRVMWQPEHLLSIGLESGYNSLYYYEKSNIESDFGQTDAKSSLSSIPLLFVVSMQITPSIAVSSGFGPSFLKTSFDAFGSHTESTQISTSYYVSTRYYYPLNEKLSFGGELRWYRIQKLEDSTLSLQIMIGYHLFSW